MAGNKWTTGDKVVEALKISVAIIALFVVFKSLSLDQLLRNLALEWHWGRFATIGIAHDPDLYKEHHLVECFINKIKHFHRITTRYDKTARAFMSMICIACMMV